MADELSILNLRGDFEEAAGVSDAARWKLEMPDPLEVLVMIPRLRFMIISAATRAAMSQRRR